jgi:hypothetical protein
MNSEFAAKIIGEWLFETASPDLMVREAAVEIS